MEFSFKVKYYFVWTFFLLKKTPISRLARCKDRYYLIFENRFFVLFLFLRLRINAQQGIQRAKTDETGKGKNNGHAQKHIVQSPGDQIKTKQDNNNQRHTDANDFV